MIMTNSHKPALTSKRANELLSYDEATGELRWKNIVGKTVGERRRNGNCAGKLAGHKWTEPKSGKTYLQVRIDKKLYLAHRVIWLMRTGKFPEVTVDHADLDGMNNRWPNLRQATSTQNNQNVSKRTSRKFKGVFPCSKASRYQAKITADYKSIYLGTFVSEVDAARAYDRKAIEVQGEFARTNFPVSEYLAVS